MELSHEQSKALDAIHRWRRGSSANQEFLLGGFAGTGKTTLLQHYINNQGSDEVLCLAPTGKAASVLQKKLSNAKVSTVHRALYTPVPPSRNKLKSLELELAKNPLNEKLVEAIRREKEKIAGKNLKFSLKLEQKIEAGQLVIVDEASMVTRFMRADLLATGAKIMYVGDPGQLPPVRDVGFFQTTTPDAMLETIQRQALDSPIIRLSMQVRAGEIVEPFEEEGCRKMRKADFDPKEWFSHDQVLTGSNDVRRNINRYFRKALGHDKDPWPRCGEKLICLKNYSDDEVCLVNGGTGQALTDFFQLSAELGDVCGDIQYDEEQVCGLLMDPWPFEVHYDRKAVQDVDIDRMDLRSFDYAYAVTVHKAQGSEWDRVVLADDGMKRWDKEFRKKWLYTAITRAKKELTWLF